MITPRWYNMNEMEHHFNYMQDKNWDYSKLEYNLMLYYRAIHILAIAKRTKDNNFFNYLQFWYNELKNNCTGIIDIETMKRQAGQLSELEIPLYVSFNSGGFSFVGKKLIKGNLINFKNKEYDKSNIENTEE